MKNINKNKGKTRIRIPPKRNTHQSYMYLISTYWFHLSVITIIVSFGIFKSMELRKFAQSCMTPAMVSSDSRCLYIYQNHVYQKGSRSVPHKSNPCGTDVTSFIPSFHFMSAAQYLDPTLVGTLCSNTNPTSTPIPTLIPTNTPVPTI